MNTLYHQYENRMKDSAMVDAVRIGLDGGTLSEAQLDALKAEHPGYTEVLEHTLVLYKPPVDPTVPLLAEIVALTEERDELTVRLVSPPVRGEPWDGAKRYIRGDTALDGGVLYTAKAFNRGKQPSLHPLLWDKVPEAPVLTRWEDDPASHPYVAGDLRTYDLDGDPQQRGNWRCKKAHTKSTVRRPMAVSDYWEVVAAQMIDIIHTAEQGVSDGTAIT